MSAWRALSLAACLAGMLAAPDAAALWDDKLELFAAQTATRDDNIFRLSPGNQALLGIPQLGDTYRASTLGLKLDLPFGRQRFQGGLEANRVRFDRLRELDFDGHEARALWQWGLGDDLNGRLGLSERRTLASLASVPGDQNGIANVLTTRQAFASGKAMLTPSWELGLEGSRLEQSNEAVRLENDLVLDRGEATLSYVSRAGNRLGLRDRVARGTLPNRQLVGSTLVDNSYRQRELGVVAEWRPGGHSQLRAGAGRVRRGYVERPQRDFDGRTYELAFDWTPTDKLALGATARKGISATEEIQTSFVFEERVALKLAYRPSAISELSAQLETSDRGFFGGAGQADGNVAQAHERLSVAALAASYRPSPHVTLQLSVRRETRSAEYAFGDYAADIVSLGARLGF